ncbi:MAG: response regulator [Ignavibacteriales bacterium]|nr:MAG: response regulator [Ignavibacteriales bacterium]
MDKQDFYIALLKPVAIFCLAVILFTIKLSAQQQGLPVIKNYLPKDYKAHNQNWAIVKDNRGVMYFGNSVGVLEFDGQRWNLIKVPNGIVRSLAVTENGIVAAGSADDFGYLERKNNGSYQYKSLLKYSGQSDPIGHVWHTIYLDKDLYFITRTHLYKFKEFEKNIDKPVVEVIEGDYRFRSAFKYNGKIYLLDIKDGLLIYDGKQFQKIQGSEIFTNNTIYSMLPYDDSGNEIFIATKSGALFIYDGHSFKEFKTEVDGLLQTKNVYLPGAKLPDGNFVINTSQGGLVIIDRNGKLVSLIDMKTGIADDGVLSVLYSDNKLWLALQNGISVIDLPSPVSYFNQDIGLKGSVSDVKIFNNNVYAATTAGIYKFNLNAGGGEPDEFSRVSNLKQEGWAIITYKNNVMTAVTDGVFLDANGTVKKLNSKWTGCYYIYNSKIFPNRIYAGLESGLAVLEEMPDGNWIDRGKINGIETAIRYIIEDQSGNLWLGTPYNGVYKISELEKEFSPDPVIKHFIGGNIPPNEEIKIFPNKKGLLFTTKKEVLNFNNSTQQFEKEKDYGFNEHFGNIEILFILQDKDENFWISAVRNSSELLITKATLNKDGSYQWNDLSFLKSVIDFSNSNAVFSIFKDEDKGTVWFCGADGIVCFNSRFSNFISDDDKLFPPMIRRVTIDNDSLLFAGDDITRTQLGITELTELRYGYSSLRFEFSSMKYDDKLGAYQYMLEGFDADWSGWISETRKDYTNLPAGKYVFKVRSKDINNNISEASLFSFTVLAPWYLSWYAYVFYVFIIGIMIYSFVRIRLQYLTQRNIKLETIISDRTKQIQEQAEKLKELDEVKSRFFTNISHEFRTPLTLILGQIESSLKTLSDNKIINKLQMSFRNAKRLERLINQLLEISKLESGKNHLRAAKRDFVKFVHSTFFSFESYAEQKNISLRYSSGIDKLDMYFDLEKMEKVFNNLFNNAIKFTDEGGVIDLNILLSERTDSENQLLKISIKDTGLGIPKEKLLHIFDRFYQVEGITRSDAEGSGIGLTLSKELIELHSGTVSVSSEEGNGTEFIVHLPTGISHLNQNEIVEIKDEPDYEPETKINEEPVREKSDTEIDSIAGRKDIILIVEDNSDIRSYIKDHLEENYTIVEAENGKAGFETARKIIPDLIITDVIMPLMNGYELSSQLRNDALTYHIPIIILTAKAKQEEKIYGLETGVDDYLTKPFSSQELLVRVKNLIQIRKRLREKFSQSAYKITEIDPSKSLDHQFIEKVKSCILQNISDPEYSIERLAGDSAISVSQLNRKLNALIGQPAGQYMRNIRLEKAAVMLKNKEAAVKEIAYQVGFTEQSNFAKSFKKHFGYSPSDFINQ